MSQSTPMEVGPYRATRLLATGAQSQVWLAEGPAGEVALKIARTDEHRQALSREIAVLGKGEHPGLVRMLDHADDGSWMAMERVKGALADRWAGTRAIGPIVDMAVSLLRVLGHLHGMGVVHGDIKPANVLVDNVGRPRLLDLGIATLPTDKARTFKGTLGFAAPEILKGSRPSPVSDIYGFGALLYRCLAGRSPFVAPDPAALTYLPLVSLPAPPSSFRPDVPKALDRLVLGLLSRDPKRRPGSLDKIIAALEKARDLEPGIPVLGMHGERDALRRAVVGAADGEPRIAVVYGPPGSGRRTLMTEAVEAARREGLAFLRGADAVPKALDRMRKGHGAVLVLRSSSAKGRRLAALMADEKLPGLLLLHGTRPVTDVDAPLIHLTPTPLARQEAEHMARIVGVDHDIEDLWRQSRGLPAALVALMKAAAEGREPSADDLSTASRQVFRHVASAREIPVHALAESCEMDEHTVLDHCEVLFACGLVRSSSGGASISLVGI